MEVADIYALCVMGILVAMIGRRVIEAMSPLLECLRVVFDRHLQLPYAIEPNRWMDGRTPLALLRQLALVTTSLCAAFLRTDQNQSLVERTGYISAVQMAPCYLAIHMSYAASILCIRLPTFRTVHIELGLTLAVTVTIHVIAGLKTSKKFVWSDTRSRYGAIVGPSLKHTLGLEATDSMNRRLLA